AVTLIGHKRSSRNARSTHRFDPLSPRRPWLERIAKVLGLASYLPIIELHYAHRVRRLPIVSKDEFNDPQVGSTEYPPYSEALFVLHKSGAPRRSYLRQRQPSVDPALREYLCFPSQSSFAPNTRIAAATARAKMT